MYFLFGFELSECRLGYKATVMVRSIFLRGFDQQMSEMVGNYMKSQGTTFIRPAVPLSITRLSCTTRSQLFVGSLLARFSYIFSTICNNVITFEWLLLHLRRSGKTSGRV